MKKKFILLYLISVICLLFVACSTPGNSADKNKAAILTETEMEQLYSDPESFKGRTVGIYGQIFSLQENDDGVTYLSVWTDPENSERNILITCSQPDSTVKNGDCVRVTGTVQGTAEGENASAVSENAPSILADSTEIVDYTEAFSPALYTYRFRNKVQKQHGYSVKVTKVELAEKETRVYLTVKNNGSDKFSLYSYDSILTQDNEKFEEQINFYADYPEIRNYLNTGESCDGIICFPAIENSDFKLILEGSSENYDETFEPFTFDIPLN